MFCKFIIDFFSSGGALWAAQAFAFGIFLSNVFSSIDTKKRSKLSNFAIEPLPWLLASKRCYDMFCYGEVCNKLKLNLCKCSFSLCTEDFCLSWFWLFALFIQNTFFVSRGARTSNMDETDRIVFRSSVYLFIFPTNTIKQLTKLLHICIFIYMLYIYIYIFLNYYISNQIDHSL